MKSLNSKPQQALCLFVVFFVVFFFFGLKKKKLFTLRQFVHMLFFCCCVSCWSGACMHKVSLQGEKTDEKHPALPKIFFIHHKENDMLSDPPGLHPVTLSQPLPKKEERDKEDNQKERNKKDSKEMNNKLMNIKGDEICHENSPDEQLPARQRHQSSGRNGLTYKRHS